MADKLRTGAIPDLPGRERDAVFSHAEAIVILNEAFAGIETKQVFFRIPEGYFSSAEFAKAKKVSDTHSRTILLKLLNDGIVDRVWVKGKTGHATGYYKINNRPKLTA